jgi:hypothetical protein
MICEGRANNCFASKPSQYPTPGKGKEGTCVATLIFPGSPQAGELVRRGDPVTRDRGLQSPIPAFRGSVVREGDNPISGAIADVVGRSLDPAKPCLLEQPSQATPRIRFSNTLGAPQLLTDVIKALRVGGLRAAE